MSNISREEFVATYTKVIVRAWTDPAYAAKIEQDPTAALAEEGLVAPEGTTVTIQRDTVTDQGLDEKTKLDRQFDRWVEHQELHVPSDSQLGVSELSEDDLAGVAGGAACCCCCPCCCFTINN